MVCRQFCSCVKDISMAMITYMPDAPGSLNLLAVLSIGLIFGLKHATEVDHVVAITTIVSCHRNVFRSAIVGALWGAGHSASLLIMGVIVLSLRVAIPQNVSGWLEFGVALMIIALGVSALWRATRKNAEVHVHQRSEEHTSELQSRFGISYAV